MIKKLPKSKIEISLSVPASELDKFIRQAAEELGREIKIPGFRPGKAPLKIMEQRIGTEKILAHAAEKAIKKHFVDAIAKNNLETVGEPKITITKIAPGNDLDFKAEVAVIPKVSLGNYRSQIKSVTKPKLEDIKPEEIQKELEYLRKSRAKLITVSREAKKDDRVEIDFQVLVEGKEIEGGKSQNHPLTIGESYFIPGFEENLIGMKEGEEKEFDLSFPKDYHKKELSGKPAKFKVKMNLVQEKELPQINDELAKSLGRFESLEDLRSSIKEGLEMERKNKVKLEWQNKAIEKITSSLDIEIPDVLLDSETEKMLGEFEGNISSMGMNLDQYLENIKKSKEDLKKDWEAAAVKRIKAALALQEIAELENIVPDGKEIESKMNETLAYFKSQGDMEKNVDMEKLYSYTRNALANEKVLAFLESLQ